MRYVWLIVLVVVTMASVAGAGYAIATLATIIDIRREDSSGVRPIPSDCTTDNSPTECNELGKQSRERPPVCTLVHYWDTDGMGTLYTTPNSLQRMVICRCRTPGI